MKAKTKYKVGNREAFKLVSRYAKKRLIEQIKAVALIIIYLILFQTLVLGIPLANAGVVSAGLALVLIGLTFFMEGLMLGLMPLGETLGLRLPLKIKVYAIVIIGFILGLGATFAEPAIGVLRSAGVSVRPWSSPLLFLMLNKYADYLIWAVGAGVGVAVMVGMLRFLYGWSLKPFIYTSIGLLLAISAYAVTNPNLKHMLGIAWDCGGVTTGPVTVPLILALGIGISRVSKKRGQDDGGGFGVVTLASIFPAIAVLLTAAMIQGRVPAPMPETEFFSSKAAAQCSYLFENEDQMKGYALKNTKPATWLCMFDGDKERLQNYLQDLNSNPQQVKKVFGSQHEYEKWMWKNKNYEMVSVFLTPEIRQSIANSAEGSDEGFLAFFGRQFANASRAIIPLSGFLILVFIFLLRERLPRKDEIILGLCFAVFGMAIFSGGIELGLSKIGDQVGNNLPASFSAIPIESERVEIPDFDETQVNSAVQASGKQQKFFYFHNDKRYEAVSYHPENYNKQSGYYSHIPMRGPLFGSKGNPVWGFVVVLLFAFIMGYGATLAEPALNALGITVEELTVGTFKKSLLIQTVAIGVGVGLSAGMAKIIWDLPLFWMLLVPYLLLMVITKLSDEDFVNIGWDSAGVTTGPITVPLVLSMGLGIGSQVGVVEGFGIISMASVCPIISVLTMGLIVKSKRKKALKELAESPAQGVEQ